MLTFLDSYKKMPLLNLPVRSTLVTVGSARLLISPGTMLTEDQLKSLGVVTDIIANSYLHAEGVVNALKVFPNANVWGPPGIEKVKPHIKWTHKLNEWPYQEELPSCLIEGMPMVNEYVFYHKPTQTLIVADLFFNLRNVKELLGRLLLVFMGTNNKFALSRLFTSFIKDKEAFRASVQQLLHWPIDRVVVGHGEILTQNAQELVQKALK